MARASAVVMQLLKDLSSIIDTLYLIWASLVKTAFAKIEKQLLVPFKLSLDERT